SPAPTARRTRKSASSANRAPSRRGSTKPDYPSSLPSPSAFGSGWASLSSAGEGGGGPGETGGESGGVLSSSGGVLAPLLPSAAAFAASTIVSATRPTTSSPRPAAPSSCSAPSWARLMIAPA